ncbi:MAG: hypothetical protein IJ600_01925 [Lachnospiraceae bacterium]|nr:hypothetical protein [Lachnospiraceae bacterium]
MDKHVRNLTILAVVSVLLLALLLIWYANRPAEGIKPQAATGRAGTADPASYRAFLKDDLFFDPEPGQAVTVRESENTVPRLYMTATSIMKDIRIMIQDEDGEPVKGISFYVKVDPLGEYKDLDRDGLIYIPELKAGEYFLTMSAVEGYETPTDPMRVSVKEQLEYTVIDDIMFYVYTEDEVDVAAEDTAVQEAGADADETEHTGRWEGTDAAFGIDVSKYQKEIDWQKVAAAGVEFAIIRCGYRGSSTGKLVEDPYFERNIKGATEAGIGVGVYFFTQAVNEVEAVEEASMAAALCKGYDLDYPIFIDVEGAGGNGRADGLDRHTRTAIVKAFCETAINAGYHGGVYSGRYWFYNNLNDDELQDYTHWLAEYRANPLFTGKFRIWQYTSSGSIDGISTRVDLNRIWQ